MVALFSRGAVELVEMPALVAEDRVGLVLVTADTAAGDGSSFGIEVARSNVELVEEPNGGVAEEEAAANNRDTPLVLLPRPYREFGSALWGDDRGGKRVDVDDLCILWGLESDERSDRVDWAAIPDCKLALDVERGGVEDDEP